LTGAREPPIGVRFGSIDRFERIAVSTIRCFFLSSFRALTEASPPRSTSHPQAEKEALISSARAEVAKEVAATKAKMDADIAEASAKAKADVDRQIAAAIAKLDAAKAESAAQVETKATELSNEIINKVVNV
jgi:F0F1-type ATP synthase membrane subunit b/b'